MIVKKDDTGNMVCPMGLGSENGNRCYDERCMAWRDVGDGKGFCGMCPVFPIEMLAGKDVNHD
jgi:hypothetical protein